ncbi:MAG: cytochrome c biogenesis protein [Phycisphaerae bacterium]
MSPLILTLGALMAASPAAKLPAAPDLTAIRAVATQHDGRWPPLDTVAREIVWEVTGTTEYQGRDPVWVLLAWTFDPQTWTEQPLIKIRNAELRSELELPASRKIFSYAELIKHHRLTHLIRDLARIERGRKMNPLESKVSGINEKLGILQDVFSGRVIRLIPDEKDYGGVWRPIGPGKQGESDPVAAAWADLRTAFLANDAAAFDAACKRLTRHLDALPAAYRPTAAEINRELHYNAFAPFHKAAMLMVCGALFAAIAMLARRKWFDFISLLPMVAGFVVLSYGLWIRWQIAGRVPASNMYESLLFLGWGVGLFAILATLLFKHRLVPFTASAMAALALFLADLLPMNPFIRPITPVLQDTVWMAIHVPIIMVSYSVLALGVLIAHIQIVAMAVAPNRRQLSTAVDALHYWYLHVGSLLLAAGILTGSMWAASSWGRYWGWDPKEVWSLVALLGYLTILHVRIDPPRARPWAYLIGGAIVVSVLILVGDRMAPMTQPKTLALLGAAAAMAVFIFARGSFATAVKSILCFWLIIMTYVGVNYVLGTGLHSYGFGTGAVVKWMFLLGGIDLALLTLFSAIYLRRRGRAAPVGMALPVATAR